jgi:hypothetical protein
MFHLNTDSPRRHEAHDAGIEILDLGYSSRQGAKLETQFFNFASLREIHPSLVAAELRCALWRLNLRSI